MIDLLQSGDLIFKTKIKSERALLLKEFISYSHIMNQEDRYKVSKCFEPMKLFMHYERINNRTVTFQQMGYY